MERGCAPRFCKFPKIFVRVIVLDVTSQYRTSAVRRLHTGSGGGWAMSLVRLLGFHTLACGCVIGRYRELATSRELTYIEEKGVGCQLYAHRRNHTITTDDHSTPSIDRAVEHLAPVRAS